MSRKHRKGRFFSGQEMEFVPLRTLDEQIDAVSEWRSPAWENFIEGVRRARALGLIAKDKLV